MRVKRSLCEPANAETTPRCSIIFPKGLGKNKAQMVGTKQDEAKQDEAIHEGPGEEQNKAKQHEPIHNRRSNT